MKKSDLYIFKGKCIITASVAMLLISIGLMSGSILDTKANFEVTSINTQNVAAASVAIKNGTEAKNSKLIEVETKDNVKKEEVVTKKTSNDDKNYEVTPVVQNTRVWYMPTEQGYITQYPSWGHVAYDIGSPRGSNEVIYPVADGIISSIYRDGAGALIVTVRHIVDGKYYSSQYVHLSGYANISVGQNVTHDTPLGWMGSTGNSTGVHLHLALVDCNMFGPNDACSDLNGFFNYGRVRLSQGFYGLGSVGYVPGEWTTR